jgi:hypothetical protein
MDKQIAGMPIINGTVTMKENQQWGLLKQKVGPFLASLLHSQWI